MDCKNAQTLIAGYLIQNLIRLQVPEIEDHIHECAAVPKFYATHQVLSPAFRQALSILRRRPTFRSVFSAPCAKRPRPSPPLLGGCPGRGLEWRLPWRLQRLSYLPFFRFCAARPRRIFSLGKLSPAMCAPLWRITWRTFLLPTSTP